MKKKNFLLTIDNIYNLNSLFRYKISSIKSHIYIHANKDIKSNLFKGQLEFVLVEIDADSKHIMAV